MRFNLRRILPPLTRSSNSIPAQVSRQAVLQEEQAMASPANPAIRSCSSSSHDDEGLRRLGIGRDKRERERERERVELGEVIKICVKK